MKTNRIFPFFGEDIDQLGLELLIDSHRQGATLIPLNARGLYLAWKAGLSFELFERWLGIETTMKTRWVAEEWERQWYLPARAELSSHGICWPVFDREALSKYWSDLTLAAAFASACGTREVKIVDMVINDPLRPSLFTYRSDIHFQLMRTLLGEARTRVYTTHVDPWWLLAPRAIRLDDAPKNTRQPSTGKISGNIVLALNPGEFNRFLPVIRSLARHYPGQVVVISLWKEVTAAENLSRLTGIPVVSPADAREFDASLGKRFFNGYCRALAGAEGKPWKVPMAANRYHFEFYCLWRLPVLAANHAQWQNLWRRFRPRLVITSNLPDAEAQLPAQAARAEGIQTVALPHGGFGSREYLCYSQTVLYNCIPAKKVFAAAGLDETRLRPCREIISENEYPVRRHPLNPRKKPWRVLALTNPIKFSGCLFNQMFVTSQADALRSLIHIPKDLADKVSMRVKPHPGRDDKELFLTIGSELTKRMLPPDIELAEALNDADLVVALNYSGTALIYTFQRRKPVVFFWNDPFLLNKSQTFRHAHLMLEGGAFAGSADALWKTIRRFFTEPAFATQLTNRADRFARDNLDTDDYPQIGDIVRDLLTGGSGADEPVPGLSIQRNSVPRSEALHGFIR
jgi:hypothetical protein